MVEQFTHGSETWTHEAVSKDRYLVSQSEAVSSDGKHAPDALCSVPCTQHANTD